MSKMWVYLEMVMNQNKKIKILAEKAMGWEKYFDEWTKITYYVDTSKIINGTIHDQAVITTWNPYENISHTWMIVEKMRSELLLLQLSQIPVPPNGEATIWSANFGFGEAEAGTAQEAICEAVLKVVENG